MKYTPKMLEEHIEKERILREAVAQARFLRETKASLENYMGQAMYKNLQASKLKERVVRALEASEDRVTRRRKALKQTELSRSES